MSNLAPRPREELAEFEGFFQTLESLAGYLPTAYLTLGHQPDFLRAMTEVSAALRKMNGVDPSLKVLMSHLSSSAVVCRFCEAHTAKTASSFGVSDEKLRAIWEFETSELFTEAERAALRLALAMVQQPSAVDGSHFDALRQHFDDPQIAEMVITVSMFGFWNRWNDTMETDLEEPVYKFASALLSERGWDGSRHYHGDSDAAP
ncbi:MAG: carboxymuconolactone decarboxylase family protein [Ilumatobacteraceae bacterium]|nr:carboxymuconolactone decarboxylase family protein [Ilumatobacteraceae bacterium]